MKKNPNSHSATPAWAALLAGVILWDVYAPETLSHAVHRGMENPKYKFMLAGAIGATAAHLAGILPPEYDPFCFVFEKVSPIE